jgi:hypothetical protein
VFLLGRNGFGDAIYTRAIARASAALGPTWLATAWPQLFGDLDVRLVPATTRLYGPRLNIYRSGRKVWSAKPESAEVRAIRYDWAQLRTQGILAQMERKADVTLEPFRFDLPPLGPRVSPRAVEDGRPVAIVRPVATRRDWPNPARNPDPLYVARAAALLIDAGYYVISVANLLPGIEEPLEPLPPAHERYDRGELGVLSRLTLIRDAALVVGGPGWVVPACLASGTPLLVIGGGQGGCNGPTALMDSRIPASRVRWILPAPYCDCTSKTHACPKMIPEFDKRFGEQLAGLARGRAA